MWTLFVLGLVLVVLIAFDAARASRCELCLRRFGVFSIRGRLRVLQRVCWSCRQVHERRRRNYAR